MASSRSPRRLLVLAAVALLAPVGLVAASVTLSSFTNGTVADANAINDNFLQVNSELGRLVGRTDFEGVQRDCTTSGSAGRQTYASGAWGSCVALPGTAGNAARSCLEIKQARPGAPSGNYTVDPDGTGTTFAAASYYCDMVSDGGGWTLCYASDSTVQPTSTPTGWSTRVTAGAYRSAEYARDCKGMTAALGALATTARAVYKDSGVDAAGQNSTLIAHESPPPSLNNGYYEFDAVQGLTGIGIEINNVANPARGHCWDDSTEDNSWGRVNSSTSCWLDTSATGWYSGTYAVEYWLR